MPTNIINRNNMSTETNPPDFAERQRRRAFAHYDCQSLAASLKNAATSRAFMLTRRQNTPSRASAASKMDPCFDTSDADDWEKDFGDGRSNELVQNCPYFRNEIGGEKEWQISATRIRSLEGTEPEGTTHIPGLACGLSILESVPNEDRWKDSCIYQKGPRAVDVVDHGAHYYRWYFHSEDHQNWFGMDERLGPVAISVKREELQEKEGNTPARHKYRLIIRTSEILTLRGSIMEDSIPNRRGKHVTTKDVLECVAPEIKLNCLRLGVDTLECEQQLMTLDEQRPTNQYKVGILYCKSGQSSEAEMYSNEKAGPEFIEFLNTIGRQVRLKGFDKFSGGLDTKSDSTGTHSLYATHNNCEIMFHVSTMLPFASDSSQQLFRKQHIGNDVVTIVFQESGAQPFTARNIRSQFQHVFIIIRVVKSGGTFYRVAVSRSKDVLAFGPPIPAGATFTRGKKFVEFLYMKIINAKNAVYSSEKFTKISMKTRQEYLKNIVNNFSTTTTLNVGTKFSIFTSKKKEKAKAKFSADAAQQGAFCWQVIVQDAGISTAINCLLGISADTFVLVEECSRQIVFVTPTKGILGWFTRTNELRIYHHRGECITMNMKSEEQLEVVQRLRSVTPGCDALEFYLSRNSMKQLSFHVQPDGLVTKVDTCGQAWEAGLRRGFRLVEICNVIVATISIEQMIDLLKSSGKVRVTAIESLVELVPRNGCFKEKCEFNIMAEEAEYSSIRNLQVAVPMMRSRASPNVLKDELEAYQRRRYARNLTNNSVQKLSSFIYTEDIQRLSHVQHATLSPDHSLDASEQNSHPDHHLQQPYHVCSGAHPKRLGSQSLPQLAMSVKDSTKQRLPINKQNQSVYRLSNVEYLVTKTQRNQIHKSVGQTRDMSKRFSLSISDENSIHSAYANLKPINDRIIPKLGKNLPRFRGSIASLDIGIGSDSSASLSQNGDQNKAMLPPMGLELQPGVTQHKADNQFLRKGYTNHVGKLPRNPLPRTNHAPSNNVTNNSHSVEYTPKMNVQLRVNHPVEDLLYRNTSRSRIGINLGKEAPPQLLTPSSNRCGSVKAKCTSHAIGLENGQDQSDDYVPIHFGYPDQVFQAVYSSSEHPYSSTSSQSSEELLAPIPEFQTQLTEVEDRMLREAQQRQDLEQAVLRLTEENRRLHGESQAVKRQLRVFTDLYSQTIQRTTE